LSLQDFLLSTTGKKSDFGGVRDAQNQKTAEKIIIFVAWSRQWLRKRPHFWKVS
jgi:hypothetical protein